MTTDTDGPFHRIMIVGGSGSGKSVLSDRLAAVSHLPTYHVDEMQWGCDWASVPHRQKNQRTKAIHAKDRWIFEGGHPATYSDRASRAQLLVWLDLPVGRRMWRVLLRNIRYHGKVRPHMADGCPETFGWHTLDVIRFVWRSRQTHREPILRLIDAPPPNLRIVRLRSGRQVKRFMSGCDATTDSALVVRKGMAKRIGSAWNTLKLAAVAEVIVTLPLARPKSLGNFAESLS